MLFWTLFHSDRNYRCALLTELIPQGSITFYDTRGRKLIWLHGLCVCKGRSKITDVLKYAPIYIPLTLKWYWEYFHLEFMENSYSEKYPLTFFTSNCSLFKKNGLMMFQCNLGRVITITVWLKEREKQKARLGLLRYWHFAIDISKDNYIKLRKEDLLLFSKWSPFREKNPWVCFTGELLRTVLIFIFRKRSLVAEAVRTN